MLSQGAALTISLKKEMLVVLICFICHKINVIGNKMGRDLQMSGHKLKK